MRCACVHCFLTKILQAWLRIICREYRRRTATIRSRISADCTMNALRIWKTWLHRARDGAAFKLTTPLQSAPPISVKFKTVYYRHDSEKRQTAGTKFTDRPKVSMFAPQGRLVAPIHVKFSKTGGTWVRFATWNFTPIGSWVWERGP